MAAATAEVQRILAVNVENPLGFSGIDSAKWEMAANPGRFASRFGGEIGVFWFLPAGAVGLKQNLKQNKKLNEIFYLR